VPEEGFNFFCRSESCETFGLPLTFFLKKKKRKNALASLELPQARVQLLDRRALAPQLHFFCGRARPWGQRLGLFESVEGFLDRGRAHRRGRRRRLRCRRQRPCSSCCARRRCSSDGDRGLLRRGRRRNGRRSDSGRARRAGGCYCCSWSGHGASPRKKKEKERERQKNERQTDRFWDFGDKRGEKTLLSLSTS